MKLYGGKGGHTSGGKSSAGRSGGNHAAQPRSGKKPIYEETEQDRLLRSRTERAASGGTSRPAGGGASRPPAGGGKKRKRRGRRFLLVLGIIVLILLCAVVAFEIWVKAPEHKAEQLNNPGQQQQQQQQENVPPDNEPEQEPEAEPTTGRKSYCYTFLIAGRDEVSNSTDTIMVGMLDTKNHKLNIVSIPRDTLINSAYNIKKINYVYPAAVNGGKDGVAALQGAIENMLGYAVDSYAIFDVDAFVDVLDAMGGIYYDVPFDMYYDDPTQDYHVAIPAGYQWLSGEDAMKVFRFRVGNNGTSYPDGDIGRINTQHDFMISVAKQMLSVGNIPNLSKVIDVCMQSVDTNLTANNMAFYAQEFLKLSPEDITIMTIPAYTNGAIKGMSYVFPIVDEWVKTLNEYLNPFYEEITEANLDMIELIDGQFVGTQGYVAGGADSFQNYGGGTTKGTEKNIATTDG